MFSVSKARHQEYEYSQVTISRILMCNEYMMTSLNKNVFRVTGPLWWESTGHRWIPITKTNHAKLLWFFLSTPEQTVGQTIGPPVIWDAIALIMMSLSCITQSLLLVIKRVKGQCITRYHMVFSYKRFSVPSHCGPAKHWNNSHHPLCWKLFESPFGPIWKFWINKTTSVILVSCVPMFTSNQQYE